MIIYFTGTGNSRYTAERIADRLGDRLCDAASYIREKREASFTDTGPYVFAMPVYVAAPPMAMLDFIRRSSFPEHVKAYFVMTCGGDMSACPDYCRRLSGEKGFEYMGCARVIMPQNYIAFFKMKSPEENRETVRRALSETDRLAELIKTGSGFPPVRSRQPEILATKLVIGPYYRLFIRDKAFRSTERCIGCGRCAAVCPLGNIRMENRRPVWGGHCTHCMACINLCPRDAIEYGRGSAGKCRYKGPESVLGEERRPWTDPPK